MSGPAADEVSAPTVVVTSVVVEDEGVDVCIVICVVVVTGATLVSILFVVGSFVTVSVEAVETGDVVEIVGEPVFTSSSGIAVVVIETNVVVVVFVVVVV